MGDPQVTMGFESNFGWFGGIPFHSCRHFRTQNDYTSVSCSNHRCPFPTGWLEGSPRSSHWIHLELLDWPSPCQAMTRKKRASWIMNPMRTGIWDFLIAIAIFEQKCSIGWASTLIFVFKLDVNQAMSSCFLDMWWYSLKTMPGTPRSRMRWQPGTRRKFKPWLAKAFETRSWAAWWQFFLAWQWPVRLFVAAWHVSKVVQKAFGEEKGTAPALRGTSSVVRYINLVNPCFACRPLHTSKPRRKQSERKLIVLSGTQEGQARCGTPVEHQSRAPCDPQPAWQSGVDSTLPSQPPGHLHYNKHRFTFLEFRNPDKRLWTENLRRWLESSSASSRPGATVWSHHNVHSGGFSGGHPTPRKSVYRDVQHACLHSLHRHFTRARTEKTAMMAERRAHIQHPGSWRRRHWRAPRYFRVDFSNGDIHVGTLEFSDLLQSTGESPPSQPIGKPWRSQPWRSQTDLTRWRILLTRLWDRSPAKGQQPLPLPAALAKGHRRVRDPCLQAREDEQCRMLWQTDFRPTPKRRLRALPESRPRPNSWALEFTRSHIKFARSHIELASLTSISFVSHQPPACWSLFIANAIFLQSTAWSLAQLKCVNIVRFQVCLAGHLHVKNPPLNPCSLGFPKNFRRFENHHVSTCFNPEVSLIKPIHWGHLGVVLKPMQGF